MESFIAEFPPIDLQCVSQGIIKEMGYFYNIFIPFYLFFIVGPEGDM